MENSSADQKDSGQEKKIRTLVGKVSSDKMDKTIVVVIERRVKHKMYGKYIRKTTKLYAHDETNQCSVGDVVAIKQTRPRSKKKAFELVSVLECASQI